MSITSVESLPQDVQIAQQFVFGLWTGIRHAGGPRPDTPKANEYRYYRQLFDPARLGSLSLPIGENRPESQTVALGGGNVHFERPQGATAIERAYNKQPRTRIYESIHAHSDGWPRLASEYLMRLAGCQVACTVYESSAGDGTLGPHFDKWYGAVVQMDGEKAWYLGDEATERASAPTLTMQTGDVLLLPEGLMHDVATPDYSVHLGVAILTDKPLAS